MLAFSYICIYDPAVDVSGWVRAWGGVGEGWVGKPWRRKSRGSVHTFSKKNT